MSKLLRPSLTPQHRAAITVAARRARGKITSEVAALIRAADGTGVEIGALHGLGESQTMKIRRGLAWAPLPWSSVFALGAAS
jgi:hypothetical protein